MGSLQNILLWVIGLFLAYETYKGWKLGPVRILIRVIGLGLAYFAGATFGPSAAPFLKPTGLPEALLPLLASALIGLLVYGIACFIGRFLFRKTSEQEYGMTWLIYGLTGGLLGLAFGAFIILALGVGTRVVSTFAHGIAAPSNEQSPHLPEDEIPAPPSATARQLASLKESLETGLTGKILHSVDPIPAETYVTIEKIGRTVSSPLAAQRFLTFPGAIEIAQRPEIHRLRDNPEIAAALEKRNYLSLLNNREIAKVVNDPAIKALISDFDLNAALDHALSRSAPITLPIRPAEKPLEEIPPAGGTSPNAEKSDIEEETGDLEE